MLMSKRERHFAYAIIEKDIQDNTQLIEELKSGKAEGPGRSSPLAHCYRLHAGSKEVVYPHG